jgi:hypothetical protein
MKLRGEGVRVIRSPNVHVPAIERWESKRGRKRVVKRAPVVDLRRTARRRSCLNAAARQLSASTILAVARWGGPSLDRQHREQAVEDTKEGSGLGFIAPDQVAVCVTLANGAQRMLELGAVARRDGTEVGIVQPAAFGLLDQTSRLTVGRKHGRGWWHAGTPRGVGDAPRSILLKDHEAGQPARVSQLQGPRRSRSLQRSSDRDADTYRVKHRSRAKVASAVIAACIVVITINQGVVIAEYGVRGWLEGEGPRQTEWGVRAAIGIVGVLAAILVCIAWRAGEGIASRWRDARLIRAIRRERRQAGEPDR